MAHSYRLRKGRVSIPNQIYHVRVATHGRRPLFSNFYYGRCVVQAMRDVSARTFCYVVMPDHVHWLVQLESGDLSSAVQKMKSVATKRLHNRGLVGQIWQRGFFDYALRGDDDVRVVARYIVANPLRAGMVEGVGSYSLWDAVWV